MPDLIRGISRPSHGGNIGQAHAVSFPANAKAMVWENTIPNMEIASAKRIWRTEGLTKL